MRTGRADAGLALVQIGRVSRLQTSQSSIVTVLNLNVRDSLFPN